MHGDVQPGYRVVRMIALSFVGGSAMFLAAAWLLVGQTGPVGDADGALTPILALSIWAGVTLPCLAAGLFLRGKAAAAAGNARDAGGAGEAGEAPGRIQTNLIVAGALVDGSAILAGVLYLLVGGTGLLLGGVAVVGVGALICFPRREWFEPLERIRDGAVFPG